MPIYSDIDIELRTQTDGDILRDTEEDAVLNSLLNIFQTIQGSRRMLPDFAVGIYNLLFEPMDRETANRLGNEILYAIEKWDDRVIMDEIKIKPEYDQNLYIVTLKYYIRGLRDQKKLDYILTRA